MTGSKPLVLAAVVLLAVAPVPGLPQSLQSRAISDASRGAAPDQRPSEITRAVRRALRGDSLPRLMAAWSARLARDSQDVAALFGMATAASLTYDHAAADRLHRRLIARHDVAVFRAHARLERSRSLLVRNLLRDATAQLDSALREGGGSLDSAGQAEIRIELAYLRTLAGGVLAGQSTLDSVARFIRPSDRRLRVLYLAQRTNLLSVSGDPRAADSAAAAVRIAEETGDDWLIGHALRFAGKELELRGHSDSAVALYARAETLLDRERDRSALGVVLLRHAGVLTARGEYGEAKGLMLRALREGIVATDGVVIGSSSIGLGAVALSLRDYGSARDHLERALASFVTQGDTVSIAMARFYLAMVASGVGDHGTAKRELAQAAEIFERVGDVETVFEARRSLAALLMAEAKWTQADSALRAASDIARRLDRPRWRDRLLGDEGRLALRRGDLVAAEWYLTRDIATSDSAEHLRRYDARTRLAEVFARRGDLAKAEREVFAASEALDRYRASLRDRELRLLTFQTTFGVRDDPTSSLATVLNVLAAGGRVRQAFILAERRRARELADEMHRSIALARGGELRRDERQFGDADVDELVRRLPRDGALLQYIVAPGAPTTLFLVTTSGVRAYSAPPVDSLASTIERLRTLAEDGANLAGPARALGAALVDSVLAAVPDAKRLVIVPDGALHRVPFDVLHTADGRLLVERVAVSIVPSATTLAAVRNASRRPAGQRVRVLAFGDPEFGEPVEAVAERGAPRSSLRDEETYRSAFAAVGGLPRLKESAREAALVARYASDAQVRTGAEASAAFLKRAPLAEFDIIHFATHALVDERSAARSALALAPGEGETGFVGPGELAALRLDADVVVLSACQTAGGVLVGGEGVQGLTAPLLQAGARSVVATSWRVGDRSTVDFIRSFYDAMADGQPVADALRSAKLAALRRGAPASEWAAFNFIGDPLVRVPLTAPRPIGVREVTALGAIVMMGLVAARLWRRRRAGEQKKAIA